MTLRFDSFWMARRSNAAADRRRGMTIVEMLIAMTVSLIVIYGMMQFFGNLLASVTDGRAEIEMSGQLRSAANRLQLDLRGVTVPVRPWISPASGEGYFEYVENVGHDYAPLAAWGVTASPAPGTEYGDIDDVLALTTRSTGRPFVGQYRERTAAGFVTRSTMSHYAEVVWWSRWEDTDGDLTLDHNEVTVRRRALLIRPDIVVDPTRPGLVDEWSRPMPGGSNLDAWLPVLEDLLTFYSFNDISVRPEVIVANGQITFRFWANSLADLTKRENRYCHRPILVFSGTAQAPTVNLVDDANLLLQFPYEMRVRGDATLPDIAFPSLHSLGSLIPTTAGYTPVGDYLDQQGEDVMLSQVTAFDVKAYDPMAPLITNRANVDLSGELLLPSDPGFGDPNAGAIPVSFGAYVDLYYSRYVITRQGGVNSALLNTAAFYQAYNHNGIYHPLRNYGSILSGPPPYLDANNNFYIPGVDPAWGVAIPTYDTWPAHYEQDGVDQDGERLAALGVNQDAWRSADNNPQGLDQGTNGFDDNLMGGTDDPSERETFAPYDMPLQGIKISLRMIEPDSRQVRQMSVIQDFTPE